MFEEYINTELNKLQEVRATARIKKPYRTYKRAMMYRLEKKFIESFNTELIIEDTVSHMQSSVDGIKEWIIDMEATTKLGGNYNARV